MGGKPGYPVEFFNDVFPDLTAALFDHAALPEDLARRYQLPSDLKKRLRILMTPVNVQPLSSGYASDEPTRFEPGPPLTTPRVVWAGRFDRQKKFDLFLEIARGMPHVHFDCWGAAVLDDAPDLEGLPSNVCMRGSFESYDELDLPSATCFLYTSAWDGLPTILLGVGARGAAVVASSVGGVPELITPGTGWLVDRDATSADFRRVIESIIADPEERQRRGTALAKRIELRHGETQFRDAVGRLLIEDSASGGNHG